MIKLNFQSSQATLFKAIKVFDLLSKAPISFAVSSAAVIGPLMSSFTLTGSGYHDDQRALQILVLLLGVLVAVGRLLRHKPISALSGKSALWLLCLFFGLGLFSSVLAYSPRHALYEWSSFGLLLVLAWLISDEVALHSEDLLEGVLLLCGVGCALYVFKAVLIYLWILKSGGRLDTLDFIHGFSNYRFFNHIQTISLPVLSLLVLRSCQRGEKFSWQRIGWYGLLSLWWTLLFASGGRGTFIGLLAGVILVLLWRRRQAFLWCGVMLRSGVAGLIAFAVFFSVIPMLMDLKPFGFFNEIVQRSVDNPASSRFLLWQRAGEMIFENPFLGSGPLHFAHYGQNVNNGAHPHNWVLQVAAEWGVPALLCLIGVIFGGFKKLLDVGCIIPSGNLRNQYFLTVWLAAGAAIFVDGLVSGLIVMPGSQLWIVLYIGLASGWVKKNLEIKNIECIQLSKNVRFYFSVLFLMMLFFLVGGIFPEVLDLVDREEFLSEFFPHIRLAPRIWGVGYF